ncbi:MAG: DUF1573 domain-containing protein [Bacteroidales bacterium]|jgi:hypothetical protein
MKHLLWMVMLVVFATSCANSGSKKISTDLVNNPSSAETTATNEPQIKFEKTEHDFGRIIQGERVTYQFKFTNTGQSDLLISKVSTSCGCTVGKYTKTPIAPGESDVIEASFDSSGRKGIQKKTITVLTNTQPNTTTLLIKAEIVMPENI